MSRRLPPPKSSRFTLVVAMVSLPPSGIASLAFVARFMITCSRCVGSTRTFPALASAWKSSSICSPMTRRSNFSTSARISLTLSTLGWRTCLLPKASNWEAKVRASLRGFEDHLQAMSGAFVVRLAQQNLTLPQDNSQQIIEIGRRAGEPSDSFEFLQAKHVLL